MRFIELTGKQLSAVIDDKELYARDLKSLQISDQTIVRVNEHGDIEVRRPTSWEPIGGLLGEFSERLRKQTGLEWV